jgi:hypothetical protein
MAQDKNLNRGYRARRLNHRDPAGALDKSVTSQALATSRMKLPVLPSTVATRSTANVV